VAPLFAGNPADPAAWRDTIARVSRAARHRDLVSRALLRQIEDRGGPQPARAAARALAAPDAVAIVTGQQAGVFGGPLYTALKAVTAIQLAQRIQREQGVPVVPLFWVDAEDHDWEEIRKAEILDRDFNVVEIVLGSLPGAGTHPVGSLMLDDSINRALKSLSEMLPPGEFSEPALAALSKHYTPGATISKAFAGWIEELLGHHGLVVFDAGDPTVKPAVADIFVRELRAPARTCQLVHDAGTRMLRLGHHPQVEPVKDAVNLFYLDESGRRPIKQRAGQFVIGDTLLKPSAELVAEATDYPERFSPNVILRPLVQDRLFPTICYIAGPSELAYQAQLGGVYQEFSVEAPLLYSRASATLVDSSCIRFLERYDVPLESLHAQDESVLNRLLERQLPPSIDHAIADVERQIADGMRGVRETVTTIDPTLSGVVDTTVDRVKDTLKNLHNKIVQASKKKDDTLRRQFVRTRSLAFPGGAPQERVLSIAFFVSRYGPAFADRLLEALPEDVSQHYLLTL